MGLLKVGPDSAGADPGPACYGPGGAGADRHRRRPPPGLPRRRLLPGRPDAARRGGGPPGDRDARGATDGPGRHRGRLGHPPGGQREHGGRRARARDRARQGPARLPALRLRRRGAGARLAGRPHLAGAARARPLRRGRALGLRAAGRAARVRFRADRAPAPGRGRLGAHQPALPGDGSRGPTYPAGRRRARRGGHGPTERRDALLRTGARGRRGGPDGHLVSRQPGAHHVLVRDGLSPASTAGRPWGCRSRP